VYRSSSFLPLTPVVKNLIIGNVLFFLAQLILSKNASVPMNDWFAQHHVLSDKFRPHQFLTAVFMHGSWGHLFGNMLGLYLFGTKLELVWGAPRFLKFYLICGVAAGLISGLASYVETYPILADLNRAIDGHNFSLYSEVYNRYNLQLFDSPPFEKIYQTWMANPSDNALAPYAAEALLQYKGYVTSGTAVGASGAIFGLIAAAAFLFPNDIIYFNLFIPIKMKWFALIYAGLELSMAIQNNPMDQVGHVAHLGGALVGFLIVYFGYRRKGRFF